LRIVLIFEQELMEEVDEYEVAGFAGFLSVGLYFESFETPAQDEFGQVLVYFDCLLLFLGFEGGDFVDGKGEYFEEFGVAVEQDAHVEGDDLSEEQSEGGEVEQHGGCFHGECSVVFVFLVLQYFHPNLLDVAEVFDVQPVDGGVIGDDEAFLHVCGELQQIGGGGVLPFEEAAEQQEVDLILFG
jgi:hypothetical protein